MGKHSFFLKKNQICVFNNFFFVFSSPEYELQMYIFINFSLQCNIGLTLHYIKFINKEYIYIAVRRHEKQKTNMNTLFLGL